MQSKSQAEHSAYFLQQLYVGADVNLVVSKTFTYSRNGKNIVQQVTGGEKMKISRSGYVGAYAGGTTKLEYEEIQHAITGAKVRKYGPPEYSDVREAITAAIDDLNERQAGNYM